MNNKLLRFAILLVVIVSALTCKRNAKSDDTVRKPWKNVSNGFMVPSQLLPIYSNTEINDVLDGMARGIAIIANDTHASPIQNVIPFRNEIMAAIPNGNDEATFSNLLEMPDHFHIDGVIDSSSNAMFGDAIDAYYGTNDLYTDVPANLQQIDIYMHGFDYQGAKRGTLLRIPAINLARQNTAIQQRPILVIPARKIDLDDDFETPIYGFYWDPINKYLDTVQFTDQDSIEFQTNWWVWVVDYAGGTTGQGNTWWSCSGEFQAVCGDGNCDSACGETVANCPDCVYYKKRKLYLDWVEINPDRKHNGNYDYDYMESYLRGGYELNPIFYIKKAQSKKVWQFSSVVGYKWDNGTDVRREKWKNGSYIKSNGVSANHRVNQPQWGYRRTPLFDVMTMDPYGNPSNDPVIDPAFNPTQDTIYVMWLESDGNIPNSKQWHHGVTIEGVLSPVVDVLIYEGDNENPCGPKRYVPTFPATQEPRNASPIWYHWIRIVPTDWSSGGLPAALGNYDFTRSTTHNSTDEYFINFGLRFE